MLNQPDKYYAKDRATWRRWLKANHLKEQCVWLVLYKKNSKKVSVGYEEAVEEGLCFGWIDSTANKRDSESFILYFASRKRGSVWSKINKERISRMIAQGLMEREGLRKIEEAKKDGSWTFLDAIEELEMPPLLRKAFSKKKAALRNFEAFPPSVKKGIFYWIVSAKRDETRDTRIKETVTLAVKNVRAHQWKRKE